MIELLILGLPIAGLVYCVYGMMTSEHHYKKDAHHPEVEWWL